MLMDKKMNAKKVHTQEIVPDPVADSQGATTVANAPAREVGDEPIDYEGEALDAQSPGDSTDAGEGESPDQQDETPEDYEISCWVDTVIKAEEIKMDVEKMKYVAPELAKRKLALDRVAPVRSVADIRKKLKNMEA